MRLLVRLSPVLVAVTLWLVAVGLGGAGRRTAEPRVANLHAFAKLYGYVRFFHPSDEAGALDWDRFAIYGASQVKDVRGREALAARLRQLFGTIAPTVDVYLEEEPPERPPRHVPADTAGLDPVAWQHQGVLITPARPNAYWSVRLNRTARMAGRGPGFAVLTQAVGAQAYRGKRVRYRAHVRTVIRGAGNQAQLWLRVDREGGEVGFFDNMSDRPITSPDWAVYEIAGEVAADAARITFGALLQGMGELWLDGVELAVSDGGGEWTPVPVADPGFEAGEAALGGTAEGSSATRPEETGAWMAPSPGYEYTVEGHGAAEGSHAARIATVTHVLDEPLFDGAPAPGEVVYKDLGAGLRARIPVSVYSDADATLPKRMHDMKRTLGERLEAIDLGNADADQEDVRLAGIVIAWNVFQHFYPYFDVVDVDWAATLDGALGEALEDETGQQFYETLHRLVARLDDGHGRVSHPRYFRPGRPPFRAEWIEDRAVVTASRDSAVRRGDVVLAVDGVPSATAIRETETLLSGSPQWKRVRALRWFGAGTPDDSARFTISRNGVTLEVTLPRINRRSIPEFEREAIQQLQRGIWYVDLDRARWPAIEAVIDSLAAARGVIFDLRGYPAGNHAVLRHLLDRPDTSIWMFTPRYIYPDQERLVGYRENGWHVQPAEPHIGGKVVFITDGRAISYAESVMGYVAHYGLGEIVGQSTAGANGNVNPLNLPGGFTISWTGMRVLKHDGSQLHTVGIQPTVPATRTIAGVRAGRDELLEVALEVLQNSR